MSTVEQAGRRPGAGGAWRLLGAPFSLRTWTATGYLLLSMPLGILWFVLIVTGVAVGLGTLVIWVGVPVLAGTMLLWRGAARFERLWVGLTLGADVPDPYRPAAAGSLLRRWRVLAVDPATWKDLVYLLLLLPLGVLWFSLVVTFWTFALGLLTLPLWYRWAPVSLGMIQVDGTAYPVSSYLVVDTLAEALWAAPAGLVLCLVAAWVARGLGVAQAGIARALLGPSPAQLAARVDALQTSRARTVDAAATERRRIERDLHDGAQQRLVALAMDLGMAKEKLATDPNAASSLVAEAHEEAKRALAELRDLARGIHPAVLTDRGLDAAISALAARSPVPVDVTVATGRLPDPIESIAYFVVAEALTNAAKHARATEIAVRIAREGDWLVVEVRDDGAGGADPAAGGGLAGLADRAAGVDGRLTVTSPAGGPTVVRAELPVASRSA